MNTNVDRLLVAQAKLLVHITERVVALNHALEAHIHEQVGTSGPAYDAHYARRRELFAQDMKETTDLLSTLDEAIRRIDEQ